MTGQRTKAQDDSVTPGVSARVASYVREPQTLFIDEYQRLAKLTDRKTPQRLDFPLLGLFGEAGSLLSELKKKQRDAESYISYEASVVEELGDVLWYFANLAARADIQLSAVLRETETLAQASPEGDIALAALQPTLNADGPADQVAFEATLMRLAGEVGKLAADFSSKAIRTKSDVDARRMSSILEAVVSAANEAGVSLAVAAARNLEKVFDRWPEERNYPPLFDEGDLPHEQLPRIIRMHIFERTVNEQTYVFLRCNDINIGDRLTDNKLEEDDYRFHDVFHLAYAAFLGWSPVLRSLFRVKRKSKPKIDEAEDGARAILIEEGVSTWIFNHAAALNFFENLDSVDYGLLKAVRELVSGYDAARCPLWLWEEAILKGYDVFRELRRERAGIITADLSQRTLTFETLPA